MIAFFPLLHIILASIDDGFFVLLPYACNKLIFADVVVVVFWLLFNSAQTNRMQADENERKENLSQRNERRCSMVQKKTEKNVAKMKRGRGDVMMSAYTLCRLLAEVVCSPAPLLILRTFAVNCGRRMCMCVRIVLMLSVGVCVCV